MGASASASASASAPLADAARSALAELVGSLTVDPRYAQHVIVALDCSASMRPRINDGTVRAVVEVLAAVAGVLGVGCEVIGTLAVTGTVLTRLPDVTAESLPDILLDAATRQLSTTGFRADTRDVMPYAPLSNVGRTPGTLTYLVTDTVPSNVAEFTASAGSPHDTQHLVVLTSESAWQLLRLPATPCTLVDIPTATQSPAELLRQDPDALRALLESLLSRQPAGAAPAPAPGLGPAAPRTGRRAAE